MKRREFLKGVAALPAAAPPPQPPRQLALHLDYRANVRINEERLTISFDLWRSVVNGIGGEASLNLQENIVPDETAWRASAWLIKQAAIEAPFDRDIPVMLQMQDFGVPIPLKRMAEFFSQGACEIVLSSSKFACCNISHPSMTLKNASICGSW